MKINNTKDTFVLLLNDLRQGAQRANEFFQDLVPIVQEPEVREVLEARVFLSGKIIETLDQCFKLMGEKPAPLNGSFLEIFFETSARNSVKYNRQKQGIFSSWQRPIPCCIFASVNTPR